VTDSATLDRLTAKVTWAKKHLEKLENSLKPYPQRGSDFVRFEDDGAKRERSYYLVKLPDIPPDVPLIAGDILQNLRSSIDHVAYHLVQVGGGTATRNTYFPIAQTSAKYYAPRCREKIKGARPEAVKYLDSFQPYKDGTHLLWELHELNNLDKHRLLLTACSTNIAHSMSPSEKAEIERRRRNSHPATPAIRLGSVLKPFNKPVPLKIGDKLLTIPHSEMEQEMRFLIDVAFNEPRIVGCRPIVELLHLMSNNVLNIITGLSLNGFL
jgi:hypothetical protein